MAVAKPVGMNQDAWDYLLRFTKDHEHPVLHMYNNRKSEADKQDVTCGIGFQLPSPEAAVSRYKDLFFDPATDQPASDEQIKADWTAASKILRTQLAVSEYATACKLRMRVDKVFDKMGELLKGALATTLTTHPTVGGRFWEFPDQAQVACISLFYGYALAKMPLFKGCLEIGDFCGASGQSSLSGASSLKNNAHKILLQNACTIVECELEFDILPLKTNPPDIVPAPGP
jgi:hypothetical protein